jgi:hypothetical protein
MKMLNRLHSDGSIKVEGKINIIVSPYADNFFDEIEVGIKDAVRLLLDLGYLTISSCDGNNSFSQDAHVTVVLDNEQAAKDLIENLNQLGIDSIIDNTFKHFGVNSVNEMFMRQYVDYCCVSILIYEHNILSTLFKKYIIRRNTRRLTKLSRYLA